MPELAWEDEGAHGGLMHRRSNASCLTEREVEEFLFNRLSGVTREVIEEHMLVCRQCQDRVEKEEEYLENVRAAARECEQETLERAYSGGASMGPIQRWRNRFAHAVGLPRRRNWTVAFASLLIMSTAVLWQYRTGSPGQLQEVGLELHRGAVASSQAPAMVPLKLSIAVEDLAEGSYSLELIGEAGTVLATGQASVAAGKLPWVLEKAYPAGTYWIRLRRPEDASVLIREYGLKLR